jgi:nitrilase
MNTSCMKVGAAQIRPVWLDKVATGRRVIDTIEKAAAQGIELLAFSETYLAGYPFWLCRTDGAAFEDRRQQRAYSQFLDAALEVDSPILRDIVVAARDCGVAIYLGVNERGRRAGRGTVYCTLITIDVEKGIVGAHRKLMPTHDERLCWGIGDARDLRAHDIGPLRVGGLNCWENWMPIPRSVLYGEGEDLHISVWPGNPQVANDAPRLIAIEGRVWSVAASGVMSIEDVPDGFEFKRDLVEAGVSTIFRGGSRIIDPNGVIVARAADDDEEIISWDIDLDLVRQARQSFDPSGHYSRGDLFNLDIQRRRPGEEVLSTTRNEK